MLLCRCLGRRLIRLCKIDRIAPTCGECTVGGIRWVLVPAMVNSIFGVVLRVLRLQLQRIPNFILIWFHTSFFEKSLCCRIKISSCSCFRSVVLQLYLRQSRISAFSRDENRCEPITPAVESPAVGLVNYFDSNAIILRRILHCYHGANG